MSYTFGGATADDIVCTSALNMGADNSASFVAGWWYPTTLTATRGYWSAGNVFGAEVDTTTSEIRLRTDNTTDGQWVTSGAGIDVNRWWFLAFLAATENTTVAGAWRVWVGTADTAPVIQTPAVSVSRSGNYSGATTRYLGNKGTGTLAFQGDIGWGVFASTTTIGINSPFYIGTSGAIADTEARLVEERWVLPLWRGMPNPLHMVTATQAAAFSLVHMALDVLPAQARQWSSSTTPGGVGLAVTVNGATYSQNEPPVRLPLNWVNTAPRALAGL